MTAAGSGEAVFEVFTPWIIVAKVNDLDDGRRRRGVDRHARRGPAGDRAGLARPRQDVGARRRRSQAAKRSVDLDQWVKGTYGFLLKLQATGQASDLVLRAMTIETWVQVAPISLPRLKRGVNRCRYEMGDRYGKLTMPMFVLPNVADPEDLKKYVVEMPSDYDLDARPLAFAAT